MVIRLGMWLGLSLCCVSASAGDVGNRLTYLDSPVDPYYVDRDTARLITPQWVGDEGVEAVIVLAIDDMTDADKYEQFLRPILDRLKQIDGRAPVSIMTKQIDPTLPRLQSWAEEGVSVEAHTQDHPCPCLQAGSFEKAKSTFDRCVDQLSPLPGGGPVAFRMPCCDSMNSVSPRFFAEIFNKTTPEGHFLTIDTSVFMLFTANDPDLPRDLVYDEDGREKFRKYIPTDRTMANYVEDYPYPYVIGRLCWEIPQPDAQRLGRATPARQMQPRHAFATSKRRSTPRSIKQGVFALCFHPHGWIRNDQVVELIDYADKQYGKRVKFLNFREVQQRLDKNLLGGHPLRTPTGRDNGVRVVDVDADGFMDVVIANPAHRETRVWRGAERWMGYDGVSRSRWSMTSPGPPAKRRECVSACCRPSGRASIVVRNDQVAGVWHFDGSSWQADAGGLRGLELDGPIETLHRGQGRGCATARSGPGRCVRVDRRQ